VAAQADAQKLIYEAKFDSHAKVAREDDFIEPDGAGGWRRTGRPAADAEWIAEGHGAVQFANGRMRVVPVSEASPIRSHMVVWNKTVFPADFRLEFDMNPEGSQNGLTIVFFCAAGPDGKDIFDVSLPGRRADYPAYHSGAISNYSDAYWSRNTQEEAASNRLRRNPGFSLVAQGPSRTLGLTDVTHRVRIVKDGKHIEVAIDGVVTTRWDDPQTPLGAGRIGLRSMDGVIAVSYGAFRVWSLK
jgi:hypothetical protein